MEIDFDQINNSILQFIGEAPGAGVKADF